jgi:glycosyltransferase involved in cell wall biosynthesis
MKILIVNSTNNIISGAELAILDMIKDCSDSFTFEIFTPGRGKLTNFFEKQGFKVHYLNISTKRRKYPGLYHLSSLYFSLFLKKNKFDLLLCNTFAASVRVSLAAEISNIPLAIYVREYFSKKKKNNLVQLNRAKLIFAVSKDVKNYIGNLHGNVRVCYDTIDVNEISKRVNQHLKKNLDINKFNVGFMGRITSYKQPDLFIKSFKYLSPEIKNIHFHLVGASSSKVELQYEKDLKKSIKNAGLTDYITFWGYRKDSIEILSEFDVFCMTSDREPFPRTILESLIVNTLVICSNSGGCLEMIKDNQTGIYFDVKSKNNHKDLADKISEIYFDNKTVESLIFNGNNYVNKEFKLKKQIKVFIKLIKENFSLNLV